MNTPSTTAVAVAPTPWLKSRQFDLTFIVGVAALALLVGFVVNSNWNLFFLFFAADLWLLGYHHVVSTYTRLVFDLESFKQHYLMVLALPVAVAFAVGGLAMTFGLWLIPTIYLHWQWYHYTRQSEGISKAFRGKCRNRYVGNQNLTRILFWLVPIAGIATISSRDPQRFLGTPVEVLPVPVIVAQVLVAMAVAAIAVWIVQNVRAARRGELALPYFLYLLSHFAIYLAAYVVIEEINIGWLTINIWHNLQYILFVWMFNNRRFGGKLDKKHVFLSTISQSNRFVLYIAVCLTISTAAYYLMTKFIVPFTINSTDLQPFVIAAIFYQTINFHHYIVDSRIWKLRKKPIRETLGIKD